MRIFILLAILLCLPHTMQAEERNTREKMGEIRGEIRSGEDNSAIQFATITIDGSNQFGAISDENGRFRFRAPLGEHTIIFAHISHEEHSQAIKIEERENRPINITLTTLANKIEEVTVNAESNSAKINKMSFNVQAVAIDDLKNTTANLSDVLSKAKGVRIRESGGVGSEAKISVNGFSGSHVKIFVDGILQGNNSAFSINNIPANYAERIEVYSGAAPIEFGADALGAVINIVTKKHNQEGWNIDASYSYGSFNTHRSDVTYSHQYENGFQYKINAYQNYSDNNYKIDNTVTVFNGSMSYTPTEVHTVERFNDTYHNEAVIAEVGYKGKKWADVATLSMNYAQFYKEVQTGTMQSTVYGARHREGYSLIPTLQYSLKNAFAKGLDIKANANYNYGVTLVVDTTVFNYNWFGETQKNTSRSYTYRQTTDNSMNASANAVYKMGTAHTAAVNYSINSTARRTRSAESGTEFGDYATPQYTTKGVTGLSYMYNLEERFNAQAFGKYYSQINEGMTVDDVGIGYYHTATNGYWGYGAATTGFFLNGFQAKVSYEKAYRLPTTTELFGDSDLEIGTVNLNPESSDNYNTNLTYRRTLRKHNFEVGGGLVYSDSKDFIRRVVSSDGESATYSNHGKVETKGWNASMSYNYGDLFSIGGSINSLNTRDNEPIDITTGYASTTYGQRMPNEPYLYANGNSRLNFNDLFTSRDNFHLTYNLFYQHSFPLDWEEYGDKDTKKYVPTQLSHDVAIHYTLQNGKYNFSFECRNLTNAKIYDNYSLQKAGRAFYGKFRINLESSKK